MLSKKLHSQDVKKFLTAGKATFTLRNQNTGSRMTLKITQKKDSPLFVSVMMGSDNERSYKYIGYITTGRNPTFRPKEGWLGEKATLGQSAMEWLWDVVCGRNPHGDLSAFPHAEVWHAGKCARCGRKLTTPESIERGFGPVCWSK